MKCDSDRGIGCFGWKVPFVYTEFTWTTIICVKSDVQAQNKRLKEPGNDG